MREENEAMPDTVSGLLKRSKRGGWVLYDLDRPSSQVAVPNALTKEARVPEGTLVAGPVQTGRQGPELAAIESLGGLPLDEFQKRTPFDELVAIDPTERFDLGVAGDAGMRLVDLIAPIGKGTRGLIVSPPKAGKTILLEHIGAAIRAGDPDARIIVLLIDERPEEVTYFRRQVKAEVFASSSDKPLQEHVELAELMLAHIRVELECGRDVVVLVDSLTRMARTYNLQGPRDSRGGRAAGSGRTLSGGLEAGAMQIPRRFFGVARNVENGGSITIIATILVDTGSRLDQVIFEEFKGTGNSEIVLDRSLAEARIFPAINITASGTRKDELLYRPDQVQPLAKLHRALVGRKPMEAMELMLKLLDKYPTNEELLRSLALQGA
jgi:transcription termination factor Rho